MGGARGAPTGLAPGGAWRGRCTSGARLLVLSAALLTVVGLIGHSVHWVMLTTTLGPTAYLLLAHPDTAPARTRSAVLGHGCAVATALACLALFGLWHQPSTAEQHHDTLPQIGAQAVAVGVTLLLLTVLDAHHAPSAASALLVSSGIARPGPPLYGMLAGLAIVVTLAPLAARLSAMRRRPPGALPRTDAAELRPGQRRRLLRSGQAYGQPAP